MKTSTSTHEQEHDQHQAIPSDVALRVKALESLLGIDHFGTGLAQAD
jgi:hypothetical protein